ncbi:MAG: glycosyltransferase family 39 protein [Candidatus Daviesbacteria bacterium]|nr:glycosyltransferase family 39 protein [Candidatus Daviesbacteria bacterium]
MQSYHSKPKLLTFNFALLIILIIGAFLRFYKLDFGQGFFTHPDEYHIVISASQLSFPTQMHPNFFSYGTVSIYLIYFTKEILSLLNSIFNFEFLTFNFFLIGRFYSALFSTASIFLVFKITSYFGSSKLSLLAALLTATTPGAVQQAHFATPESTLIFCLLLCLFFLLKYYTKPTALSLIFSGISFGLALGVKASSLVFILAVLVCAILTHKNQILKLFQFFLIFLISAFLTLLIVAPFIFLDFPAFLSNLQYEGSLARGVIPVFYTRQFIQTSGILFQLTDILPYALGPVLLTFGVLGFLLLLKESFKRSGLGLLILLSGFLSLFLFNSLLFAKWTRFISPTFPFFAIFSSCFLVKYFPKKLLLIPIFLHLLWTVAFFSIYIQPDVRVQAQDWLLLNLPKNSVVLVEGGNMVEVPTSGQFTKISLDFYSLDTDPSARLKVALALAKSDYFIVQSRRVFSNHQRLPEMYPKTANFYDNLFEDKLGFVKVAQFDSYPTIPFLNIKIPDEQAEETWSVFDHPVIRVYQKNVKLSESFYVQSFNQQL